MQRLFSIVLAAIIIGAAVISGGCGKQIEPGGTQPNIIVLGFDGMDFELTKKLMTEGRLPNFSRLAKDGHFQSLGTAIPPQSPVAWSDFITGMDSGGHGIFDFIHRDPETMKPFQSTSIALPGKTWPIGKYLIPSPFSQGSVELLRKGTPFWSVLEDHGIETTVIRMPANFPPSGTAGREISGMGTPDMLGTYGTFTFVTSDPFAASPDDVNGGEVRFVDIKNGIVTTHLYGPDNPFLHEPMRLETSLVAYIDHEADAAKILVGDNQILLSAGEWSDWLPISFTMIPTQPLPVIARLYLRSVAPHFELYVTPLQIDPTDPKMPISTPDSYAGHLCRCTGYFYTQGMPEDTSAVTQDILTLDEFLTQANLAGEENIAQYHHILSEFEGGFLFHYFGNVDLVGHIVWRSMDPEHPAYVEDQDAAYAEVIPKLYERMDSIVGHTLENMPEDSLVVVMSDHGFAPWRRAVHLNTWLLENQYLHVKNPDVAGDNFSNVDWSKTQAYGLGLNGLYINLKGRESCGIVDPEDRSALVAEIAEKLLHLTDPSTDQRAITKAYIREETYMHGQYIGIGPDIQVGYAEMTRGSNESALGKILPKVFTDNLDRWSGDHCMDHESVPGILLTSRPLGKKATELKNLAAAILAEYGIEEFPIAE